MLDPIRAPAKFRNFLSQIGTNSCCTYRLPINCNIATCTTIKFRQATIVRNRTSAHIPGNAFSKIICACTCIRNMQGAACTAQYHPKSIQSVRIFIIINYDRNKEGCGARAILILRMRKCACTRACPRNLSRSLARGMLLILRLTRPAPLRKGFFVRSRNRFVNNARR